MPPPSNTSNDGKMTNCIQRLPIRYLPRKWHMRPASNTCGKQSSASKIISWRTVTVSCLLIFCSWVGWTCGQCSKKNRVVKKTFLHYIGCWKKETLFLSDGTRFWSKSDKIGWFYSKNNKKKNCKFSNNAYVAELGFGYGWGSLLLRLFCFCK